LSQLRVLRLRAQSLAPRRPRKSLLDVVRAVCGVNAQLPSAMCLSLRARLKDLTLEDIQSGRVTERRLVRTWCMRGTMHLLAADDLELLLSAIAPAVIRGGWRWLEKRGGLRRERAAGVLDAAHKVLKANGPMSRPDLMEALAKKYGPGIKSAAAGVVQLNGVLGAVCFGPDQGAKPTYAALDDWLGRKVKLSKKPDHAELARRYLQGYGPAAPRDLAAWWGLGLTETKAAWKVLGDELIELDAEGQQVWLLASDSAASAAPAPAQGSVRLVPAFDTYLLGYRDRSFAVHPDDHQRIFHGGEMAPVILEDGFAIGTWRYEQRGEQVRITAAPFSPLKPGIRAAIAQEAEDIGRFLGLKAALTYNQGG